MTLDILSIIITVLIGLGAVASFFATPTAIVMFIIAANKKDPEEKSVYNLIGKRLLIAPLVLIVVLSVWGLMQVIVEMQ